MPFTVLPNSVATYIFCLPGHHALTIPGGQSSRVKLPLPATVPKFPIPVHPSDVILALLNYFGLGQLWPLARKNALESLTHDFKS